MSREQLDQLKQLLQRAAEVSMTLENEIEAKNGPGLLATQVELRYVLKDIITLYDELSL